MATDEQKKAWRDKAKPPKAHMTYHEYMGNNEPFGAPECPLSYHDFIREFNSYITINNWDDYYKFIIYQYFAHLHTSHRKILNSDLDTYLQVSGNPDELYDVGSDDWTNAWKNIYGRFIEKMRTTIRGSTEFELSSLTKQYEQFEFDENETVLQAHARFTSLIKDIRNCDPNSNISFTTQLRKFKQSLPNELRLATILADHNPLYQINSLDTIRDQEQKFTSYLKLLNDTQTHLFNDTQKIVQQRNNTHVNAIQQNNNPSTFTVNKPCRYFLTPRGCIKGDDCTYLHVADLKSWMQQNKDRWTAIPEPYRKTLIETYNNTQLALKNQNSQKTNIHVSHLSTAENNALAAMNDTTYQNELNMLNPQTPTTDPLVQSLKTENEQLRSQLQTYAAQQEHLINKFESLQTQFETIATPAIPALAAAEPVEPPKRKCET